MTAERVAEEQAMLLLEARTAFTALAAQLDNMSMDLNLSEPPTDMFVERLGGASALALAMRAKLKHAGNELDEARLRQPQMSREAEAPAT